MIFSDKQEAVFKEVKEGKFHINIQATAGSGKTTTILNALNFVPVTKRTIFLSFSNGIVNELKSRVPGHIKASTLHSLGMGIITSNFKVKVEGSKYFDLAIQEFPEGVRKKKETRKECAIIQEICSFARMTLTPFKKRELEELCAYYNIDFDGDFKLIDKSIKLLKKNTKSDNLTVIDFSDMIYFPAVYPELIKYQYDCIFLDEAQDTNKAQLTFVENILHKKGRLIAVGDKNQVIYGFSGSDIKSFERIKERTNTTSLPLTVTYRCSKEVVKLAQSIYPLDIQHHPDAIDGFVGNGEINDIQQGDMVICRNTRPLVSVFFKLLEANKKSYIVGKDLEKGIISLTESAVKYASNKDEVNKALEKKLEVLLAELLKKEVFDPMSHPTYLNILEKCNIIRFILNKVNKIDDLIPKIHDLFREVKDGIQLLTIHRSKGLESKRVFFVRSLNGRVLCPSSYARKDWELIQENNLLFVCYTRAKECFYFIDYEES